MPLSSRSIAGYVSRALTGCLILSLVQDPLALLAAGSPGLHSKRTPAVQPLTEEERAEQALNRLTFGPRPGDLERVQAMGLKKWIEMQLNPEQIDDSLLEAGCKVSPQCALASRIWCSSFPRWP